MPVHDTFVDLAGDMALSEVDSDGEGTGEWSPEELLSSFSFRLEVHSVVGFSRIPEEVAAELICPYESYLVLCLRLLLVNLT
jgi:hypothetical protein